jgi:hypothetical protein
LFAAAGLLAGLVLAGTGAAVAAAPSRPVTVEEVPGVTLVHPRDGLGRRFDVTCAVSTAGGLDCDWARQWRSRLPALRPQ